MKLLLDTHIWLWALLDPQRLSDAVAGNLRDPQNEVWLSPVSVWEALSLVERGRLKVKGDAVGWMQSMLGAIPRHEAPLTHAVAIQSRRMALAHEDPADRFLAATALVYGLTLVTADERLLGSRDIAVMPNA